MKLLDFGLAKPPDGQNADPEQTLGSATEPGLDCGHGVLHESGAGARGHHRFPLVTSFPSAPCFTEMITGERPFGGANPIQTLLAISTEEPPFS